MNVMNEFFKKLAEEAFFDEASSIPSDIMYKFSDHKMQKFAELIVRECASLCIEIGEYGEYPESEAEACAEYIFKHFGVK